MSDLKMVEPPKMGILFSPFVGQNIAELSVKVHIVSDGGDAASTGYKYLSTIVPYKK